MWTLSIARRVLRVLRRLGPPDRARLLRALDAMRTRPLEGDVVRLTGQPAAFRRRVGDWRIFFDVDAGSREVQVTAIVRRITTTYRRR